MIMDMIRIIYKEFRNDNDILASRSWFSNLEQEKYIILNICPETRSFSP